MLAGFVLPGITWIIFAWILKSKVIIENKKAFPYEIAILLNLLIIRYLFKKGYDQTGSGMILCTFVAMILVFMFKTGHLI